MKRFYVKWLDQEAWDKDPDADPDLYVKLVEVSSLEAAKRTAKAVSKKQHGAEAYSFDTARYDQDDSEHFHYEEGVDVSSSHRS